MPVDDAYPRDDLSRSLGSSAYGRSTVAREPARLVPRRLPPGGILLGPALLIAIWQAASMAGWLSPRILAAPTTAAATALEMLKSGALAGHLLASAERAYLGLAIGVAAGAATALVAGLSAIGEAVLDGLVQIKRAIPTLALIPLGIFVAGYRRCDEGGADRHQRIHSALPGFLTGLRLAVTTCWTALVVLEQINATNGIGYLMSRARDYGQTDVMVVGLVVYAVLGLGSDLGVRLIERRALSYRRALGS